MIDFLIAIMIASVLVFLISGASAMMHDGDSYRQGLVRGFALAVVMMCISLFMCTGIVGAMLPATADAAVDTVEKTHVFIK